jgi:ketosteroid isomerase-like protein
MKQKLGIVIAILAFAAVLAISLNHDSKANAARSPEQAIKKTVLAYLNSINSGDIDTLVQYTDDLRYPDKTVQKANYTSVKLQESITDIVINTIEPLNATSYKASISAKISGTQANNLGILVVNKYGEWLVVTGQQQAQQQQQ